MKKWKELAVLSAGALLTVGLAACGNDNHSSSESNSTKSNSKTEKVENVDLVNKNDKATFKDNTFTVKGVAFKITSVKTFPSESDPSKKTLVLETDITNNTNKAQSVSTDVNPYEFVHATQNTDNAEKELQPGMIKIDPNTGNSPEQQREDNMNNSKVLPHKTIQGMIAFDTINNNPVKVTFDNTSFKTIATKTYNLQ